MKYDVFISHSSKDTKAVKLIVDHLENNDLKCFVSYRDIPHCDNWAEILMEAIQNSAMVVYVHTKNANDSEQVAREIQISVDNYKMPCVTYRLDDEPFKGAKAFFIQTLNWIDSLVDPADGLDALVASVKETLAGREIQTVEQQYSSFGLFVRKYKAALIALVALVCVSVGGYFAYDIHRTSQIEKAAQLEQMAFESALDNYHSLVNSAERLLGTPDSVTVVFKTLEQAESIANGYAGSSHSASFNASIDEIRERAMSAVGVMVGECSQRIRNFYRTFQLVQMDEIRKDIESEFVKLNELNAILGRELEGDILRIKSSLGL